MLVSSKSDGDVEQSTREGKPPRGRHLLNTLEGGIEVWRWPWKVRWHGLPLWNPRECGVWWEKPFSIWGGGRWNVQPRNGGQRALCLWSHRYSRAYSRKIWGEQSVVWEPREAWGLVKERCETWRFSWLLSFSPSVPSCLRCLIGGEKDQASLEGSTVPEVKHLFWELLVQMTKLVPGLLLLLYPVIKVFWVLHWKFTLLTWRCCGR